MYVGFRGAIDPQEGADFALTVIAAAIIGGTPLSGGSGTVIGAVVGMLIIQVISSGIIFFGIDETWSTFVTGAVIVLAVVLISWSNTSAAAPAARAARRRVGQRTPLFHRPQKSVQRPLCSQSP